MKLDERYFQMKGVDVILLSRKYLTSGKPDVWAKKLSDFLKQLARDAAEAQRERCASYCEYKTKRGCVNCPEEMEIPND